MREEGGALEENHENTPVYIFLTIFDTSHQLLWIMLFYFFKCRIGEEWMRKKGKSRLTGE